MKFDKAIVVALAAFVLPILVISGGIIWAVWAIHQEHMAEIAAGAGHATTDQAILKSLERIEQVVVGRHE